MEFFNQDSISNLPVDYGNVAMDRGQARQIIDRFTQEAVKKNITPDALYEGLYYLGQVGQSPDFSRSMIRNTLKNPMGSLVVENPELASQVVGRFGGMLQTSGINPALAGKHMGLVGNLLKEAKKDNLLRSNVTTEEVRKEIQQPMHGALQDWLKANQKNPAIADVLLKSRFGAANIGAAAATKFDLPRLALDF